MGGLRGRWKHGLGIPWWKHLGLVSMTADLLDYLGVASLVGEGRGLCGWGPWERPAAQKMQQMLKKTD